MSLCLSAGEKQQVQSLRKRFLFAHFTVILLLSVSGFIVLGQTDDSDASVMASGSCGKSITWTLDSDGTMTLTGSGPMYDGLYEAQWFSNKNQVRSLVIGEGITLIGSNAFDYCINLSSITFPSTLTTIKACAFSGCNSLKNIIIPDSVSTLGSAAFSGCKSLESVSTGSSLTTIEQDVFNGCTALTYVSFHDSLTTIERSAFAYCTSLKSITLSSNVTTIESYAFRDCSSLLSFTIPASVSSIGSGVFSGCDSLSAIDVVGSNNSYKSIEGCLFDKAGNTLISCPGKIESYTIPSNVTTLVPGVFSGNHLRQVLISSDVLVVNGSFSNCYALQKITITDNANVSFDNNWLEYNVIESNKHVIYIEAPSGLTVPEPNAMYNVEIRYGEPDSHNSNIALYATIGIIAIIALIGVIFMRKKV